MSKTTGTGSSSSSNPQADLEAAQDDWTGVTDPNERRKIQNRIAQRKFREKTRQQRQDDERRAENERRAGAAYTPPDPRELDKGFVSGPPWGSVSLKHVIETGQQKDKTVTSKTGKKASSSYPASRSSRPGLHLIDQYARGRPAWSMFRVPQLVVEDVASLDTDTSMTDQ